MEELKKCNVICLRLLCKNLKISPYGNKEAVVARITTYLNRPQHQEIAPIVEHEDVPVQEIAPIVGNEDVPVQEAEQVGKEEAVAAQVLEVDEAENPMDKSKSKVIFRFFFKNFTSFSNTCVRTFD